MIDLIKCFREVKNNIASTWLNLSRSLREGTESIDEIRGHSYCGVRFFVRNPIPLIGLAGDRDHRCSAVTAAIEAVLEVGKDVIVFEKVGYGVSYSEE